MVADHVLRWFGQNTRRRLTAELKADIEATIHAIEEANVLKHRHLANADFYENKVAFLVSNLASTRRRLDEITTPTAEGTA